MVCCLIANNAKDLSTGPTSLIGLLTSHAVDAYQDEYTPSEIASAMALLMGVYGMILGFLKLGFLLEYVSLPILNGFISAVAITIILNQMDTLLGEDDVRDGTAHSIHDIFAKLPEANGWTCLIGFTSILFLFLLDQAGKRWANKYKAIWLLSITRAFLCLLLFTGISYAVNKPLGDKDNFLWAVAAVKSKGIEHPKFPNTTLIGKVASRSIALFIGAAVEHTGIARAFGVRNNYTTDQSQELTYFGVTNFFNSFFHSMGVGGAMSRTAVNSSCKVKSPLSGFVTMAVVLVSIYELVGALYWIPKTTLAAIIICAVWPLISSPATFYSYWKTSLADFISAMLALWVSLFVSNEIGLAVAVGFNIIYCMMRQTFARVSTASAESQSELEKMISDSRGVPANTPDDVRIFRFADSFFFPNSYAIKTKILDVVRTHHAPEYSTLNGAEAERNWSVVGEKRLIRLRKEAHILDVNALPPIRLLVLDFVKVNHMDYTALRHLRDLIVELKKYAGKTVEIRFVGLTEYVRQRFERGGYPVLDVTLPGVREDMDAIMLYPSVASAVMAPRHSISTPVEVVHTKGVDSEKAVFEHEEKTTEKIV